MSIRDSVTASKGSRWLKQVKQSRILYLLLVPTFLMLIAFNYWPAITALYRSLYAWDGAFYQQFIGLGNFQEMFSDPIMITSFRNMALLTMGWVVIRVVFPLLGAELVFNLRSAWAQYFYRVIFVIPMVIPQIVTLLLWRFMYGMYGPINEFLRVAGLGHLARGWLGDFDFALPAILFVGFPWIDAFNFLIFLAGLIAIPSSVLETALLEGAVGLRRIVMVDIPLILGQIKLVVVLTLINSIREYQMILVMTNGGPGWATMVPGLAMYQNAFLYGRMGYGSAIGTTLFVILLGLTYLNMRYVQSEIELKA
ncbi:MAG: sugar ABC transporter permease [Firmicutes bacterium]|jgi:raffinose/stachyose/melibiose transport system permease protein|nr:sugar ABC transporter permease [Bacillota bacterium]